MGKEKRFDLGGKGVNVVASPVHLEPGALVYAQNAQKSLLGEQGGIQKRFGHDLLKDTGTGPVLAIVNVALVPAPLTDPTTGGEIDPGDEMRAKVYKSASQVIANNTLTDVTWDSEDFDLGGLHSTSSNTERITVPTGGDGIWLLVATGSWEGRNAVGGRTAVQIFKNGTTRIGIAEETPDAASGDGNLGTTYSAVAIVPLVAGDYVNVKVQQNSGGDLDLLGGAVDLASFTACRIFAS